MDFTTFLWTTFGAFVTLCTFSFLYKDNPFYKFAEHLVVGAAAGYFTIILWHNGLIPKLMYDRLDDGSPWLLYLDSSTPEYLIPAILGMLIWTRFSKNYAWISRWPPTGSSRHPGAPRPSTAATRRSPASPPAPTSPSSRPCSRHPPKRAAT